MTKLLQRLLALGLLFFLMAIVGLPRTFAEPPQPAQPEEPFRSKQVRDLRFSRQSRRGTDPARAGVSGIALKVPELAAPEDDSPRFVFLKMPAAPLAEVYAARRGAGVEPMSDRRQRGYVQQLAAAQQPIVAAARELGIPVIGTYQKVLNGVQVQARPTQFGALLALSEVESLHPIPLMEPLLDHSVPHVGAQRVIDELGIDGTGVDIGIVDSGIDYVHAGFGGPGTDAAYAANDNTVIGETHDGVPLFPTTKVVGGWDFVGAGYDAGCSAQDQSAGLCTSIPQPDPDPIDDGFHGTHVAGIAAGIGTETVSHGVAPGARLWALKVFGRGSASTSVVIDAIEWAVDPDGNGDLSDALDVVNMSLGSIFAGGGDNYVYETAIANAVAAGTVVVASAGNAGDVPLIVGRPAVVPQAISVASSYARGEMLPALEVTAPEAIAGLYHAVEAAFGPALQDAGPIAGEVVYADLPDSCQPLVNAEAARGKIVLVDRGGCTFVTKVSHAERAGAVAVIVANNQDGSPFPMSGDGSGSDVGIPSVMISQADGDRIKGRLPGVTVRLSADTVLQRRDRIDKISGFSSRGPGWRRPTGDVVTGHPPLIFKPEITAPGSNVVSAYAGTGTESLTLSGTSMSAPHVAGVAALLRQAHPDWTPQQIKAAIMNTARPAIYAGGNPNFGGGGTVVSTTRMGAGLVDAFAALNTNVQALAGESVALDFGYQAVAEPTRLTQDVVLQNDGAVDVTYAVSFQFQDAGDADAGVSIAVSSDAVTVPAGGSVTVTVTVDVDPSRLKPWALSGALTGSGEALRDIEYTGWLTFTPAGDAEALSLPVYLLPRRSADVAVGANRVALDGFGPAHAASVALTNAAPVPGRAEVFTLAGLDPDEGQDDNTADVYAVGVRNRFTEEAGSVLRFAVVTHAPRIHPIQIEAQIFIDTDQDGAADYVLFNDDLGELAGNSPSGENATVLWDLAANTLSVESYTDTDLLTTNLVLPVVAEHVGLGGGDSTFDYWAVASNPLSGALVDVVPDGALETPAHFTFDGAHPLYVVDRSSVDVAGAATIDFYADPAGALAHPSAEGLLILYDSSPDNSAFDLVEIDFEYSAREVVIEAGRAGSGFVSGAEAAGSLLGGAPMWTGLSQDKARWYGVTQFDLASVLPANADIVEAELELRGLEAKYLDQDTGATWRVELLESGVDGAWPDVGYRQIHGAVVDATLMPALRNQDLGTGLANLFRLDADQTRLLEERLGSTGRLSLRTNVVLDADPRYFDGRQLFAWDGGGGTYTAGEQLPVLRLIYVAAR